MAVWKKNTEAVNYVKTILREIQNNIGQTNVEDMLREAQEMLREIKRRNFSQRKDEADDESNKAIEGEAKLIFTSCRRERVRNFTAVIKLAFENRLKFY